MKTKKITLMISLLLMIKAVIANADEGPKYDLLCGRDSLTALEAYQRFMWIKRCPEAKASLIAFEKSRLESYRLFSDEELFPIIQRSYLYYEDEPEYVLIFPFYVVGTTSSGEVWRIPGNYHTPCEEFKSNNVTIRAFCRSN